MKFNFEKVTVTKITDAQLDEIITKFMLEKINAVLHPRQVKRGDYDGFAYFSRCVNEWYTTGSVYYFLVTSKVPTKIKTNIDIEILSTAEILNWMCADGIIDAGEYLVQVVQEI